MIDFKNEAQKRQADIIADIKDLCSIPSVKGEGGVSPEAPFGTEIAKSFAWCKEKALADGFKVEEFDGKAMHIEWGEGEELLGILGHLDVVPVDAKKWTTDPFEIVERDGYLYGRGVMDDKGPVVIAYHALKALKDAGFEPKRRVRIILGGDEESGWECMDHYFGVCQNETPTFGFSPDAEFPMINAEKGMLDGIFDGEFDGDLTADVVVNTLSAGTRINIVPAECEVVVETSNEDFINTAKEKFNAEVDGNVVKFIVEGKPFHAMSPEKGINAWNEALKFLANYSTDERFGKYLAYYNETFMDDHYGEKTGLFVEDDYMGKSSSNPGILSYNQGKFHIELNYRYPKGKTKEELMQTMSELAYITEVVDRLPLSFVDEDTFIVQTLMSAYKRITGEEDAKPFSIGGATYSKTMANCVAFGPVFESRDYQPSKIHEEDENINIESLLDATQIYMESIADLLS